MAFEENSLETVGVDECEKLHTGILRRAAGMDRQQSAAAALFFLNSRTFFPHTLQKVVVSRVAAVFMNGWQTHPSFLRGLKGI